MTPRRQILTVAAVAIVTLASALLVSPAAAQTQGAYPNKPIKFVVPYPAGGFPDTVARVYAQKFPPLSSDQAKASPLSETPLTLVLIRLNVPGPGSKSTFPTNFPVT